MTIRFTKMHGLGNDFVMINAISQSVEMTPALAKKICDRHTGVGCDQLLIVETATQPGIDFNYRILNLDGSEVGQCGNGARCLARFVHEQGLTDKNELIVKTISTTLKLKISDFNDIGVEMGVPEFEPEKIPFLASNCQPEYRIAVAGTDITASVLALGNPHCVQFVNSIEQAPVNSQGPLIESHSVFPEKINACYAQVVADDYIKARVFERGVGETLACGSGACAIMVAACQKGLIGDFAIVELPGGQLKIHWPGRGSQVEMRGPTRNVFESELDLENL